MDSRASAETLAVEVEFEWVVLVGQGAFVEMMVVAGGNQVVGFGRVVLHS